MRTCFLSSFVEFHSAVVKEKSKMFWSIMDQGGYHGFHIGPKNTNVVEDVKIFLLVKFRWILFSGFRGEVKNNSTNQKPGRLSCFSDRPENTNLEKDVVILLPVKFFLISFSSFRGEVEMSQPISSRCGHLVFPISPKNTNLVEDVEIVLAVKFRGMYSPRLSSIRTCCSSMTRVNIIPNHTDNEEWSFLLLIFYI